uniref:Uncharacterized protein n=1 Tax=Burkholderia sp. M701 TaxID=326454 RepID=V5YNE8_9BURK|nr:hypothetical protein [Burkholderia sp. M701]BAO18843.1 hypothetical protein [Burkholderia sp. M701]
MDSCNGTHRPRLKRNRLLGADSARYLLGAAFGAAVFASVQFAVNHRSEIEVAPVSVDVGAVHLSPESQLAMRLSDGYNFSRKMAENAVSPGKDALAYVEYQGRSASSRSLNLLKEDGQAGWFAGRTLSKDMAFSPDAPSGLGNAVGASSAAGRTT